MMSSRPFCPERAPSPLWRRIAVAVSERMGLNLELVIEIVFCTLFLLFACSTREPKVGTPTEAFRSSCSRKNCSVRSGTTRTSALDAQESWFFRLSSVVQGVGFRSEAGTRFSCNRSKLTDSMDMVRSQNCCKKFIGLCGCLCVLRTNLAEIEAFLDPLLS